MKLLAIFYVKAVKTMIHKSHIVQDSHQHFKLYIISKFLQ